MNSQISKPHSAQAKSAGALLIAIYLIFRMVGDFFFWRQVSEYYAYFFEIGFVVVAWRIYRGQLRVFTKLDRLASAAVICSVFAGFSAYRLAKPLVITIPFDFNSSETIFLLLILAPVLEELIFRMALWQSFSSFLKNSTWVIVLTTAFFCAGHLAAYPYVPTELQSFVFYQSFYVILLGLAAGWMRLRTQSLIAPVLIHFGFNLGFYLGSIQ